jgi:pimeloyl-ACP methyl ester carboxylesterase
MAETVLPQTLMEHAEVNGVTVDYAVVGAGEPVVLIHGAFIADAFQPLLTEPSLANRYQLITYHRRGYAGSSYLPGPTSIAQQAGDCRALLAHLDVAQAHIVGHSFGGAIALQLALDTPTVVHSLALLEPALMIGASGAAYRETLARGRQRSREVGAAVVVDEFLQARCPGYRDRVERLVPVACAQAVTDAATWFETEVAALLAWPFDVAQARQITQPVLSVLGGESEALWARFGETHRWLLETLPHAEAFVLPGATHFPQFDDPRGLAEGLAAFLARHPSPR